MRQAEAAWDELRHCADTVITIPNERLIGTVGRGLPLTEAFRAADDVLRQAIQGISDLVTVPGLVNLDFADVKTIMQGMGMALMGTGQASGEGRAVAATEEAIRSPLLDDTTIEGARGVLINITGGSDLRLHEINEAASLICAEADPDANIIFGAVIDESMAGAIRVTVIATGFEANAAETARDATRIVQAAAMPRGMVGQPPGAKRDDLNVPAYLRASAVTG
jgi:cell division protein FtsZ